LPLGYEGARLSKTSRGAHRRRALWNALCIGILLGCVAGSPSLQAQDSSAQTGSEQQPPSQPASQKPPEETKKPEEKKPEEAAPAGLRLENPRSAEEQKTQQKTSQEAPAPGQLKLETPKAPPAAPETPKETKPSAAPAKAAPSQVIQEIIFRGNRRIPQSTLRARLFTHEGDLYNEANLERDFMALWNTGFLDDIRIEVTDGDKGKILTFFVREKKLVRSINYKGLSTVQQSDVLQAYKDHKVGLSIQSQYDPVVIKRAEVVLEQLEAVHGRQFCTVTHRTRNIPPNSVALTFIVSEGPKVKVGRIRFTGNTVFPNRLLVRQMKLSRPSGAPPFFYWFHKTYDKDKVLYDLEKVRELYQEHGYFYALADEPKTRMRDTTNHWPFFLWSWGHGKSVDVTIPVEEGEQYHLGKFVIRGNKLFKDEPLKEFMQMKAGDVFNLTRVRKSLENYTKLYGEFGYINFTPTPDIVPDRKKKVIDLALDFEEGKQFMVHRIEFSGNTKTRDKVIRRELLVNEGDVFNSRFWDLSVLRVNQLGFFDKIEKEDYTIHQNLQQSNVDIDLKVKEKGRNSIGFSGGLSGLAGNFVGFNYSTNNFLGLGETLSVQAQFGTFQKLYSFGFTEPYLMDRPMTTGFTIFKSDYKYDQLRQTAIATGINPQLLQQAGYGQYTQNFQQNTSGFTAFVSYPLRKIPFGRLGMTYSYTRSSLQTFNTTSAAYFQALNFQGFVGPNSLSGINSSQISPSFMYNTVDDYFNPKHGKYIYLSMGIAGGPLGGNVNTLQPTFEWKYFHPINHGRNALGFHTVFSMITGFGGRVSPPFSRFYMGGEQDIRGFDIRSISPIAYFPTITQVCNLDNSGNPIPAYGSNGAPTGGCGSFTRIPAFSPIFPGGDTSILANFEYRIPIAGPVTLSYFIDAGSAFVMRKSQLQIQPSALQSLTTQFPFFPAPKAIDPIPSTNFKPRSSTGIEIGVILPIVNAPFRVFYGYNWLRLNTALVPPNSKAITDDPAFQALFPNNATMIEALPLYLGVRLKERKAKLGFTVARTF
jgi:outer membrane protein insertion porin family